MTTRTVPADLTKAGRNLKAARDDLAAAMHLARDEAFAALRAGASEVAVAKALGVNRSTIRDWQGK
jgi:hypothetical protein